MRALVHGLMLALPLLAIAAAQAAERHPFTIHDMIAMQRIAEAAVSPDGSRVVFSLRTTDLDANRGRTDLWLVNADGTGMRRLTTHPENESSPAWAPDGKSVYFIASRDGSDQVWRIATDGGEAQQVTKLPIDVDAFKVSPDGATLAVGIKVFVDAADLDASAKRLDEKSKKKSSGQIYDQLMFRHWDTWLDGRRAHLFAVPVAGGKAIDLMKGMDTDCPTRPFGGADDFEFAPDGKTLVFSAKTAKGSEEAWVTNYDLYAVPVDGSAAPRNLTESNKAWDAAPVFSADGKQLAYRAMSRPGYEADRFRIMVQAWPNGTAREVAPAWDHSADALVWSADGKTLYVTADDLGQHSLFAVDVATGNVRTVVKDGTIASVGLAGDRLIYGMHSLTSPVELFSVKADGTQNKQITFVNKERLDAVVMGVPEQMSFTGAQGDTVYAYIVKPAGFDPAKKYPVAFLIHGGPQGSFGNDFHYRWNPQAYAGAGFAAVMVDFHGSTGYGQKFCDAIRGDWGGKPLEDLKKGLDAALAKYPWMDGNRAVALGASYGGYMINWIAGAWPDRFKALVCHDGNLDERMAYYDTEELWFPEWDHQGLPWENPEGYNKHNPAELAAKWKTPMLVIHGGKDFRVVATQGMSTFTLLQRRGIPSKFLYFPDENHWVLKPANSILWHDTVLEWIKKWTS